MKNFSGYTVAAAMLAAATLAGCPVPTDYNTQVLESPNSIDGKQIYFVPSDTEKRAGDKFYSRVVTATDLAELPADPSGHTVISFAEESVVAVDLGDGGVFYFGEYYDMIFINSDGSVGLGAPGAGNATLAEHFSSPQISLLPVDATAGGTVTVGNFEDSVVVTFNNVTIGETTDNAFQVEFFKTRGIDGDIALSWPQVANTAEGIIGASNGELAGASADEIADFVGRFRSSNLNEDSANTDTAK
jgi:hypothetical protein